MKNDFISMANQIHWIFSASVVRFSLFVDCVYTQISIPVFSSLWSGLFNSRVIYRMKNDSFYLWIAATFIIFHHFVIATTFSLHSAESAFCCQRKRKRGAKNIYNSLFLVLFISCFAESIHCTGTRTTRITCWNLIASNQKS